MNTAPNNIEPDFGLDEQVISKIRSIFADTPAVEQVIIYGSRAKGDYRPASDIDLTIIGSAMKWEDLQAIELKIDDLLLPYKTDLSLYDQIDNENLIEHIKRAGKVFYERA